MNPPLANTLTSASEDFVLMGFSIVSIAFIVVVLVILWLSRLVLKHKRTVENLTTLVESNKNDIYGLCSAALTVNENNASVHEQLHDLKQQLTHLTDKISKLEQGDFWNNPYNVDIRKVRSGASVEELMKQSDLSYDEAALLIRLHGDKV